ncbi:MAG: hypothetical protein HND48_19820 [Chloroflexi bacterium]|nr:hypothetical protein [Chloroflexota bacterium]
MRRSSASQRRVIPCVQYEPKLCFSPFGPSGQLGHAEVQVWIVVLIVPSRNEPSM